MGHAALVSMILGLVLSASAALAGTIVVERFASTLGLVAEPNYRSSHVSPTPHGGGVAMAMVIVGSIVLMISTGSTGLVLPLAVLIVVATLGFVDDLVDLSPAVRFPIQALALVVLTYSITSFELIFFNGVDVHWVVVAMVSIMGVWWLNLFNFMDGIDGIAATNAAILLAAAAAMLLLAGAEASPVLWIAVVATGATCGFLLRNWPPAKIFMGDVGSNTLAIVVFTVALFSIVEGAITYFVWAIMPAVLVTDATVTLIRRAARGERPWRAHRRHAYQQLARRWGHRATTLVYSGLTLFWAVPIALTSHVIGPAGWWLILVAYSPLVLLMLAFGAGSVDEVGSPPRA